ncbi:hypothetical protein KKH43_00915 [Patescibacteria group bacterium]|nr:hypothetical protein [Patescibacteria group bacterium]
MRANADLENALAHYTENHFCDVPIKNAITIRFGKKAKRQLGSIKMLPDKSTLITISGLFKDPKVPSYVVEETIVHEFIHYAHGFSSPLKKSYEYPHKHGIMRREFEARGLLELHTKSKKWIKDNWQSYLQKNGYHIQRRRRVYVNRDPLSQIVSKLSRYLR